jgi:hypothetical protein
VGRGSSEVAQVDGHTAIYLTVESKCEIAVKDERLRNVVQATR